MKETIKLLLVEDDESLLYIEKNTLEDIIGGYEVQTAINGREGLELWKKFRPDVIITDIEMPVMDGFEMTRQIRESDNDTIILLATALTSPKNVKQGYEAGANNYIKKPFVPEELDAHMRSLLALTHKNVTNKHAETNIITMGHFMFDAEYCSLMNKTTGEKKILSKRESAILGILGNNKNETVKRETILRLLWNTEKTNYFASRSLDVFMNKLRNTLKSDPSLEIKTIRGVGYILLES